MPDEPKKRGPKRYEYHVMTGRDVVWKDKREWRDEGVAIAEAMNRLGERGWWLTIAREENNKWYFVREVGDDGPA